MEFCILVVTFGQGISYYEARCFHTHEESVSWVREKNKTGEEFLAQYCSLEKLKRQYGRVLEVK